MKLTFLGTGTSTGVPQIRCHCPVCTSGDSRDKRLRTSAIVQVAPGAPYILIDCGPDFRTQMLRHDSPDLGCALLTHTHYDHVGGIDDLRPWAYSAPGQHFPLYCRADVARDLRTRIPYCFVEHPYLGVPQFDLHIVHELEAFTVPCGPGSTPVEVLPLPIVHGKLPILGYRIGPLAYITDASLVPQSTIDTIRGVDTLVINALRIEKHPSHQNLDEALDVIESVAPRQAYLTHASHQLGLHADVEPRLPAGVHLACDDMTINVT